MQHSGKGVTLEMVNKSAVPVGCEWGRCRAFRAVKLFWREPDAVLVQTTWPFCSVSLTVCKESYLGGQENPRVACRLAGQPS